MNTKNKQMLKRKPFKPSKKSGSIKKKPITKEEKEVYEEEREKMWTFFRAIWATRSHVCAICGIKLWGEINSCYFDHILEKSKYPELKYEPENIVLVCQEDHSRKTAGFINEDYRKIIDKAKNVLIYENRNRRKRNDYSTKKETA